MSDAASPPVHRRVVLKVGTNLLTGGTDGLDRAVMASIAEQVAELCAQGCGVILVTSGAIAAGRERLREGVALPQHLTRRQVLAAVGQGRLHAIWDELFRQQGVIAAQALLARADLADRQGYLNSRNTLLALLDLGVVSVANENDVVSIDEIKDSVIGDNDNLSAQVANLVDADLLLILTDRAGLYTADPAADPEATLIERVERIDEAIEEAAGPAGERGRGGMTTKLEAARLVARSGTAAVIADGRLPGVIVRAARDEPVGTYFAPTGDRVESRRRYLLSTLHERGRIAVDEGAARALREGGRSLLPAGVTEVSGGFERGQIVRIDAPDGSHIASGTANYAAADVQRIRGLHSDRIEEVLGYDFGDEVVHRNNLVVL